MIYSGESKNVSWVGVLIDKNVHEELTGYWTVSDRVLLITPNGSPFNCNIIQVYVSAAQSEEIEIEDFYEIP